MKTYNLSTIMKRAWEIKNQDSKNIFSLCLKMAWEEAKAPKQKFMGYAKISKTDGETYGNSDFLYFKLWIKADKKRVYINDYKRRTIGFLENGIYTEKDKNGLNAREIEKAIHTFRKTYAVL